MKYRITIVIEAEMSGDNRYTTDQDRADFCDAVEHNEIPLGSNVYIEVSGSGDMVTGQLVSVESKVVG